MSWGFEIGRVYNRRNDIHARFSGQQQGGIITPKDHPVVIVITGEEVASMAMPTASGQTGGLNISAKVRPVTCS
jgi:hypothetical protein